MTALEYYIIILVAIISLLLFMIAISIYRLNTVKLPFKNKMAENPNTAPDLNLIRKEVERLEKHLNIGIQNQSADVTGLAARLETIFEAISEKDHDNPISQASPSAKNDFMHNLRNHPNTLNKNEVQSKSSNFESNYNRSLDVASEILQTYNQAVLDRAARPKFWNQYSYVTLGNVNAVDQRLGTASKAEFREVSNGDFIAIRLREEKYFVFLQFDLTLTPQKFKESGISSAFELPDYDGNSSHSNIEIKKPAIFERFGSEWKPSQKGIIIL